MATLSGKSFIHGIISLLLTFALLLLGWGPTDLGGFFANPARIALVVVMVVGGLVAWLVSPGLNPFRKGEQPVGRQRCLVAMNGVLQLLLIWFLPFADRRGLLVFADARWPRYAGLCVAVIGGAIRTVAVRTLDKQFSVFVTLQRDHQLVQTGIYSRIRHPIYLGFLLMVPGTALVFRSWLALVALLLLGIFVFVRMRQEERMLRERFGEDFEAYVRRSWRLIPHVY